MELVEFDFGAHLLPGCLADGPGCWGFFNLACSGYGPGGTCFGGGLISRVLAPSGARHSIASFSYDATTVKALRDITGDGVLDLLLSAQDQKLPAVFVIDGASGQTLWQAASQLSGFGASVDEPQLAVGQDAENALAELGTDGRDDARRLGPRSHGATLRLTRLTGP